MHSTVGHRQKWQIKQSPQQAAKNQPTKEQTKTPTLTLPNLEIQSTKK